MGRGERGGTTETGVEIGRVGRGGAFVRALVAARALVLPVGGRLVAGTLAVLRLVARAFVAAALVPPVVARTAVAAAFLVASVVAGAVSRDMFEARYAHVYAGDKHWQAIEVEGSETYQWRAGSTYVANPPYFEGMTMTPAPVSDIVGAKPLAGS